MFLVFTFYSLKAYSPCETKTAATTKTIDPNWSFLQEAESQDSESDKMGKDGTLSESLLRDNDHSAADMSTQREQVPLISAKMKIFLQISKILYIITCRVIK